MRLKGQVRIKPVIAERDGKSGREEHEKEERDLEPVDSKEPDIDWDRSQGEKQCADEKRADEPVDSLEGYSRKHILPGQWEIRITQSRHSSRHLAAYVRPTLASIYRFVPYIFSRARAGAVAALPQDAAELRLTPGQGR